MPVVYRVDILDELKKAGYSSYRLRKDKIFGERVIQQLRDGELVSWAAIGRICELLKVDVGDILHYAHE